MERVLKKTRLHAICLQMSVYWMGILIVCVVPLIGSQTNTTQSVQCSLNMNSCRGKNRCLSTKVESQFGERPPKCYCDTFCSALNDCCSDRVSYCNVSKQTSTQHAFQTKNWKCYNFSRSPRTPGIWMIASCPPSFRDYNSTRRRCETAAGVPVTSQSKDLLGNVPVSSCYASDNCVTFRNIFCARCNGMDKPNGLSFWKISWRCNIRPPTYLSTSEKTRFLLENCPDYSLNPKRDTERRYCYHVVSNCSTITDTKISHGCARGPVGLVYYAENDFHYRNPSCLLCNGGTLGNATCGPSEFSTPVFQPKSFEMVLQFISFPWSTGPRKIQTATRITRMCGKHMYYDKFLEECRQGVLPDPMQSIVDAFRIKAWLKRLDEKSQFQKVKLDVLVNAIATAIGLSPRALTMVSSEKDGKALGLTFDVRAIPANASHVNSSLATWGLKKLIDFKKPFNISIAERLWNVFKITHRRLTCSMPEIYPPANFTLNGTHVVINNRTIIKADAKEVHNITQNNSLYGVAAGSLFLCKSFYATACKQGQVLLALKPRDYMRQNGSLLFVAAKTRYGSSEFAMQGDYAWVCTNYTNVTPTALAAPWVSKFGDSRVLWYFTVCGLSLSIVCLFTLLVTYCIFKELRTMPGKNLMSLTISLILCHFMWLLGSGDTDNPVFCRATAVVLHYLFLVSFACTTVIAFDTRRAFPKNSADMSNILFPAASKKRFIMYLLFSWGVPLVFVVTCVVIDQQGQVAIGYGNAVICWLTDMKAQILFFGVPIGVMLLFNLVAFIVTVQAIRAAKLGSKHLNRQGANRSNEIKIYFRLMAIMGFTWFFGFGAHALHIFLMYPFVVLTSLHGLYLAFAFAFKPYVYNLYRNRFANLSTSRKSTISMVDLTTSMKSNPSKETESVL